MYNERQSYLNVDEQQDVKNRLRLVVKQAPFIEKIFYEHGSKISGTLLFASNLVFFRCGFKAYNMYKYSKGRLITPLISSAMSIQGGMIHEGFVKEELVDQFRSENGYYYGFKSLMAHQYSQIINITFCIGACFLNAQLNGMIPVRTHFFWNSQQKMEAFKYGLTKLKAHTKPIAATWLITSAIMFVVGIMEYEQSCDLLAKLDRKTIIYRKS